MMLHPLTFQLLFIFPICIFLIFIPYWTRKTESFGVTISEEMYDDLLIRSMRKQYAFYMTGLSIVTILSLAVIQRKNAMNEETAVYTLTIGLAILMLVGFIVYLIFHFKMKRIKLQNVEQVEENQVVVIQTSFHSEKRTYSNVWFLLSGAIIIFTIIFTLKNYDLFPNKIPTNYNLSGEATSWTKKSHTSIMFIPIIQLYMVIIFIFTNTVIRTAKQQINAAQPKKSLQQNVLFRRRWSAFNIMMGTLTIALFSFVQFTHVYPMFATMQLSIFIGYTAVILISALFLAIKTGQGGSRIQTTIDQTAETMEHIGDDDKYWKLGLFYVNKNDPSLFIEKRFGIGWSINYARPLAWIILAAIIGLSFAIYLFV